MTTTEITRASLDGVSIEIERKKKELEKVDSDEQALQVQRAIFELAQKAYNLLQKKGEVLDESDQRMRFLDREYFMMVPHKDENGALSVGYRAKRTTVRPDPNVYLEKGFEWCGIPDVHVYETLNMTIKPDDESDVSVVEPKYTLGGAAKLFDDFKDRMKAQLAFIEQLTKEV